jgi:hypothetical protein
LQQENEILNKLWANDEYKDEGYVLN